MSEFVPSLNEIRSEPSARRRAIDTATLLEYVLKKLNTIDSADKIELGALVQRNTDKFSSIADVNFSVGVRNTLTHRPGSAVAAEVERAARHLERSILDLLPFCDASLREDVEGSNQPQSPTRSHSVHIHHTVGIDPMMATELRAEAFIRQLEAENARAARIASAGESWDKVGLVCTLFGGFAALVWLVVLIGRIKEFITRDSNSTFYWFREGEGEAVIFWSAFVASIVFIPIAVFCWYASDWASDKERLKG